MKDVEYISALVPSAVMAVAFTFLIRTVIRSQGGPNKSKEDAAADALLAEAERSGRPQAR